MKLVSGDWQGYKLPLPTNFIMGYGALINSPSRNSTIKSGPDNSTAGAPAPAIPVRVLPSATSGAGTRIGTRSACAGEAGATFNDLLYPVSDTAGYL